MLLLLDADNYIASPYARLSTDDDQVIKALIKIHTISHLLCFALNFVFAID